MGRRPIELAPSTVMPIPDSSSDPFEQLVAPLRAGYSQLRESIGDRDKEIDNLKVERDSLRHAYEKLRSSNSQQYAEFSVLERRRKSLGDISLPDRSDPRVVVFLDGDGILFDQNLVSRGEQGGLDAARRLSDAITSHLKETLGDAVVGPRLRIWMFGFLNLNGLASAYNRADIADFANVKHYSRVHLIQPLLDDYVPMPTTLRVYFGGCHDNGYGAILRTLITDGYKDKIYLLRGYRDMANEISKLGLAEYTVPGLFRPDKIPPRAVKLSTDPSTALAHDSNNTLSFSSDEAVSPGSPAPHAGPSNPSTHSRWEANFLQPDESLELEPEPEVEVKVASQPSTSSPATNSIRLGRSASDSSLSQLLLQSGIAMHTFDPKKVDTSTDYHLLPR
ncbi:uncharacterized protein SCHCODRAFT_02730943 [Schizophyllum commune H4-8]|nr:uncharacterized protein SCHCODRAFT_02730943 [Schizophyllum commune H4-8]KAI5894005.1 hypothetical protein SCHCODRAFT_02730943 [Schizophyllum commune H4-8]